MLNIIFYTNCQGWLGLAEMMKTMDIFKNYNIEGISNYRYIRKQMKLPIQIFKDADIFIYQPLADSYEYYSTKTILTLLKSECKTISFPYIYNTAMWPFIYNSVDNFSDNKDFGEETTTLAKFKDIEPIIALKKDGKTLNEILAMYDNNEISFNYNERYHHCQNILRKKEEVTDVKIVDFINKHYLKHKLFYTHNHPTKIVLVNCLNQILQILGYNESFDEFDNDFIDPLLLKNKVTYPDSTSSNEYYKFNNPNINDQYYKNLIKEVYTLIHL
jgi:hypothetical protein